MTRTICGRRKPTWLWESRTLRFAERNQAGRGETYASPTQLSPNEWRLIGKWLNHEQVAILKSSGGVIVFHFHARDLHLVLGPTADGKPVRFRVTIDGQAPGEDHGVDIDAEGNGVVTDHRLYQLVRRKGAITDHLFTIEFEDPGVQAFSFTFG